jgi:hypothetical protein
MHGIVRSPLLRRSLSTTAVGTAYELASLAFLHSSFRMSLERVGQANDGGVDLRGWWDLEAFARDAGRLRVYVQCKAERRPLGPRIVRELEGTLLRRTAADAGTEHTVNQADTLPSSFPVVGALCALSGFSTQALIYFNSSPLPMLLLHIIDNNHCSKALFNKALQRTVDGRLTVEWLRDLQTGEKPVLCWDGSIVSNQKVETPELSSIVTGGLPIDRSVPRE